MQGKQKTVAKWEAVCAGAVAGTYSLCKKSVKTMGEGGDRALPASAILTGHPRCAVTGGLNGWGSGLKHPKGSRSRILKELKTSRLLRVALLGSLCSLWEICHQFLCCPCYTNCPFIGCPFILSTGVLFTVTSTREFKLFLRNTPHLHRHLFFLFNKGEAICLLIYLSVSRNEKY